VGTTAGMNRMVGTSCALWAICVCAGVVMIACEPVYPVAEPAADASDSDADAGHLQANGGTIYGDDNTCGSSCTTPAHADSSCSAGVCGYQCKGDFLDCNGKPTDGCEVSVKSDAAHCGSCAGACGLVSNGAPLCVDFVCRASCDMGWGSCMNNPAQCETNTANDPYHCGNCTTQCTGSVNAEPHCQGGQCTFHCTKGFDDCNQDSSDGCEIDTNNDPKHCGTCGLDCKGLGCSQGTCTCASSTQTAALAPLDLYFMMDQSGSMDLQTGTGATKWAAVTQAIKGFLADPSSNGIGVGMQYFPSPTSSCTAADYATPEVSIVVLPAAATTITASLAKHGPNGGTPTAAALDGAIQYALAFGKTKPGHTVAVVLATDGMPTGCAPFDTVAAVAKIASAGVGSAANIRSFVIGVGTETASLNEIAVAGGTQSAVIVDVAGNVEEQFAKALKAIQGEALACSYAIPVPPLGQTVDLTKVNVQITLSGGKPQLLNYVDSANGCKSTTGGWHFDDPANPSKILLCPTSCALPLNVSTAKVEILLGCARTTGTP
jgi:hypothetical protein